MALVDTNIVLRWLLGDHKTLSPHAEALVESVPAGSLLITDLVAAEVVYVLRSTGRDRQQTSEALLLLGRTVAFTYEHDELMLQIIGLLSTTSLDFVDCYLLTRAKRQKKKLQTFDAQLQKLYSAK
jgi:predicted nucleic acid-binding protein